MAFSVICIFKKADRSKTRYDLLEMSGRILRLEPT
jgi:hypothetical protein